MGVIRAAARYRELGAELRKRREAAGLSGEELAHHLGWSRATLFRTETGHHEISPVDLAHYLGGCGIYRGQALDLFAMCRAAAECNHGYWFSPHEPGLEDLYSLIYHESTARVITWYEPHVVPGLLQTESYIRARTAERWPDHDVDLIVRIRLERQQILHRPDPGRFTFIISEHALRLRDTSVMQEQLLALMLLDALPHITIRVLRAPASFGGAFVLFEYDRHRPLVYLEAQAGGFFMEDKEYVDSYRELVPVIANAALDEGQSREFLATLAYRYDRGSARHVEEEQLQR